MELRPSYFVRSHLRCWVRFTLLEIGMGPGSGIWEYAQTATASELKEMLGHAVIERRKGWGALPAGCRYYTWRELN